MSKDQQKIKFKGWDGRRGRRFATDVAGKDWSEIDPELASALEDCQRHEKHKIDNKLDECRLVIDEVGEISCSGGHEIKCSICGNPFDRGWFCIDRPEETACEDCVEFDK